MGLTLHACDSLLKLHIIIYKKGAESCMILVLIKRNATTALSKALGKECFQVGRAEKGRGADVATLQTATEGYKALLPVVVKSPGGTRGGHEDEIKGDSSKTTLGIHLF